MEGTGAAGDQEGSSSSIPNWALSVSSRFVTTQTRVDEAVVFIRIEGKVVPGGGGWGWGEAPGLLLLHWVVTHPGRAQRLFPGGSRPLVPQAELWGIPQGHSPPSEAAHRPDSAARVPGRVDVRGWREKASQSQSVFPGMLSALLGGVGCNCLLSMGL